MADRQKIFGAQLGTNEEDSEEQAPKEGKLGVTVKTGSCCRRLSA